MRSDGGVTLNRCGLVIVNFDCQLDWLHNQLMDLLLGGCVITFPRRIVLGEKIFPQNG